MIKCLRQLFCRHEWRYYATEEEAYVAVKGEQVTIGDHER